MPESLIRFWENKQTLTWGPINEYINAVGYICHGVRGLLSLRYLNLIAMRYAIYASRF